jgi:hypothetical protein
MGESWATLASYRLHDLLMFSAETYFRLFEVINRQWWPAPVVGAMVAWVVFAAALGRQVPRHASVLLALAWVAVALLYFREGFAGIHWLGNWWMAGFSLQALAWLAWAVAVRPTYACGGMQRRLGLGLLGAAAAWPFVAIALERPIWQLEIVGFAPDPTVLMSLGLLSTLQPSRRWALGLSIVPLGWCVFSGATLWTMAQPHALVLPLAGAATACALAGLRR